MKRDRILTTVLLAAAATVPQVATAETTIATINGYYDVDNYDTPSLFFSNISADAITGISVTLTGYQGDNNGKTASFSLPDLDGGKSLSLIWGAGCNGGSAPCNTADTVINTNSLTATGFSSFIANDYDDSDPNSSPSNCASIPEGLGPGTDQSLCALPGNFFVTLTGTWDGQSVFSQFSPDSNATNPSTFVGFLGLDPAGYSESPYDSHSNGGPNGVLAVITEGTPNPGGPETPEPSTMILLGTGLIALAGFGRKASSRR